MLYRTKVLGDNYAYKVVVKRQGKHMNLFGFFDNTELHYFNSPEEVEDLILSLEPNSYVIYEYSNGIIYEVALTGDLGPASTRFTAVHKYSDSMNEQFQ